MQNWDNSDSSLGRLQSDSGDADTLEKVGDELAHDGPNVSFRGMNAITTWEADRRGQFQGTPSAGDMLDWLISIFRTRKIPKVVAHSGHWKSWPGGPPLTVDDAWIDKMIAQGRLPARDVAEYSGNHAAQAQARYMSGSHVIVEMLDPDRKTRHCCMMLGNVLIASSEGWHASLKR